MCIRDRSHFIRLDNVIENGTSNVIPAGAEDTDATNVTLQAYHAQLNEEFIIDPLDLIDSVDDMSANQKTELRDAARINFSNRVEIAQVVNEDRTEIPDIGSFPGSGENVVVIIRVRLRPNINWTRVSKSLCCIGSVFDNTCR